MWLYIWLVVVALSIILEFATSELVSIWFAGGGIIALILSVIPIPFYYQLIAFLVVSALLLFLCRKPIKKIISKDKLKTNMDAFIGKEVTLQSDIKFENMGSVIINGITWSAIGENDDSNIEKGTVVVIKEIKGNKLIVEEKQ